MVKIVDHKVCLAQIRNVHKTGVLVSRRGGILRNGLFRRVNATFNKNGVASGGFSAPQSKTSVEASAVSVGATNVCLGIVTDAVESFQWEAIGWWNNSSTLLDDDSFRVLVR